MGKITIWGAQPTVQESFGFTPSTLVAGTVDINTAQSYARSFKEYCEFALTRAEALQPATLERWRTHLFMEQKSKKGEKGALAVNTINNRLSGVRSIMDAAGRQGYIDSDLAKRFENVAGLKPKAAKDRRKANARTKISRDDMDDICAAPERFTKSKGSQLMHTALLMTLRYTGGRISDVVGMKQEDIAWLQLETEEDGKKKIKKGWTVSFMGKNETEPVPVELGTAAKTAIDEWLTYRRETFGIDVPEVFTGFTGRGDRGPSKKAISRVSAWHIVLHYTKRLGFEHIKPHDFRRYVGTQLAKKDIRLAQKQLRHKRIETTAQNYVLDDVQLGHMDSL